MWLVRKNIKISDISRGVNLFGKMIMMLGIYV